MRLSLLFSALIVALVFLARQTQVSKAGELVLGKPKLPSAQVCEPPDGGGDPGPGDGQG